jgi:23S rRNA pseudouridine2605 synthase
MDRVQKVLSQWGIASRRQAEQMILAGRVRLNGAIAQLGQKVDPERDRLEVDGQRIHPADRPDLIYLLINKPLGVVSTCHDPRHRKTVLELLPPHLQQGSGLHPVGRLDADSTGALLLTNDGVATYSLTHPSHSVPKTYQVWVQGCPSQSTLSLWRKGINLDGKMTLSADVQVLRIDNQTRTLLEIVLREGRNRQIRRVAEQLGHPVIYLHRTAIGSIRLGQLPSGKFRSLEAPEIESLETEITSIGCVSI